MILLRRDQERLIKLFNERKLILEDSLLALLDPFLLLFCLSLLNKSLSESTSNIQLASSPNVFFFQHLLHVLPHNIFLEIEIRLVFILLIGFAFFNLPQLSLLHLFKMNMLEFIILISTSIRNWIPSAFLNSWMNWFKETARWRFLKQIVISTGRGQTRIDWETVTGGHIHVGNLLFGRGKTEDLIDDSFWVLIKHTLSLISLPCLAEAWNERMLVHLRRFRWLYRSADVYLKQRLFGRYSRVKLIFRVSLQHVHVPSWIIASGLQQLHHITFLNEMTWLSLGKRQNLAWKRVSQP